MTNSEPTPMLRQYAEIKKKHPGTLLFFRLGDFYELFFEDAVTASRELQIMLTARHKESANPVPMCGVPHHSATGYISKLTKRGYRVAICDQTEAASKGSKLVRREVVKIITPGTAGEISVENQTENIYLAAVARFEKSFGAAFVDWNTGEFLTTEYAGDDAWQRILQDISLYAARELIYPAQLEVIVLNDFTDRLESSSAASQNVVPLVGKVEHKFVVSLNRLEDFVFQPRAARETLLDHFQIKNLMIYDLENRPAAICAAGALLRFLLDTQKSAPGHLDKISFYSETDFMKLDSLTLKNLELLEPRQPEQKSSVYQILNETKTPMGARLLRSWLLRPLSKIPEIETRQAAVTDLRNFELREKISARLTETSDLEKLVSRLHQNSMAPKHLVALKNTLKLAPTIKQSLSDASSSLLKVLQENIYQFDELVETIESAIEDAAQSAGINGTIKSGYSAELDHLRDLSYNGKKYLAAFEENERKRIGISNLKIKYNNVFGYFIEISKGNLSRVPAEYERRQTLTNAERYTTPEIRRWETDILGAEEKIKALENEIFENVCRRVRCDTENLLLTARSLATLDALQSLAEVSVKREYCLPQISDTDAIEIKAGRHPVIEATAGVQFIPNDLLMNNSTDRLLIITGPNMGGKSTVLRQTALIQILAQIGSYVPATAARLPVIDRIWTRVGASDDLASGRSTFMVEMTETAQILHNSTPRSLVLLDEIGRGTSTFDGLSIAWAVAEYLHDSPAHAAKTLFATHYHELTELAEKLPGAKNYQITAAEQNDEVVFLHKLAPGRASKSYGIAVAKLAGLPREAIERAREVLHKLERYELAVFADESNGDRSASDTSDAERSLKKSAQRKIAAQWSLFDLANQNLADEIGALDITGMSGEEALDKLRELQRKMV